MKIFSLNKKNIIDFWGAFTPAMMQEITKSEVLSEWIGVFCEAIMGFGGHSYTEDDYDWFIDPSTTAEEKINYIGRFAGGCKNNFEADAKKTIGIVNVTEEESDTVPKGCISDLVLKTTEDKYEDIMDSLTFSKEILELDDMRCYLLDTEGVDIYTFIMNAVETRKGSALVQKTSLAALRKIIQEYNLADLILSVMQSGNAIDYISSRVNTVA